MPDDSLDYLRVLNLSLLFIFIGMNIAIWTWHFRDVNKLMLIGRLLFVLAVTLSLTSRLLHWQQSTTNMIFNVMLAPTLIMYTVGIMKFYRDEQERRAKANSHTE